MPGPPTRTMLRVSSVKSPSCSVRICCSLTGSEGYFAAANARSEWTRRVHPHFVDFRRSPCHVVMTRGRGIGGALATVRVTFTAESSPGGYAAKDAYTLAVRPLVEDCMRLPFVTAAHAGIAAPVARKPLSGESLSLRPNATDFNGVVMVEFTGREALERGTKALQAILARDLAGFASCEIDAYDLSYVITDLNA